MIRLFPGMVVLDRYMVIAPPEIAVGRATIALARDHRLGGDVDLVFAPAPLGTPPGDLFARRADTIAGSQHPALPLILDRGLHDGHVVLVYRHGDGRLLLDAGAMETADWGHNRVPAAPAPTGLASAGYGQGPTPRPLRSPPLSSVPRPYQHPRLVTVPPHHTRTAVAPRRVRGGLAPVAVGLAISLLPLAGALAHTAATHAPFMGGPPWGQTGWDQGRHWRDWDQGQDAPWRRFTPDKPSARWGWAQPGDGSK